MPGSGALGPDPIGVDDGAANLMNETGKRLAVARACYGGGAESSPTPMALR